MAIPEVSVRLTNSGKKNQLLGNSLYSLSDGNALVQRVEEKDTALGSVDSLQIV